MSGVVMEAELSAGMELWAMWGWGQSWPEGGHGVVGVVGMGAELKVGMEMWVVWRVEGGRG